MHDGYDFTRHRRIRRKSVRSHNEQWLLRHLADRVSLSDSELRGKDSVIEVFIRDESVRAVLDRLRRKGQIRRTWGRGQWHYATCAGTRLDPLTPIVDGSDLSLRGIPLTRAEIEKLERQSAAQPGDLILRTTLLDQYQMSFTLDRKGARRYRNHILYLVEHKPGYPGLGFHSMQCFREHPHPRAYAIVAQFWHSQIQEYPDDRAVLANAIDFFTYSESTDAMPILEAALAIEERPEWLARLGQERASKMFVADAAPDAAQAALALAAYERAWELTDEDDQDQRDAADIAEMAFAAGQPDKARQFAQWVLEHPDEPWGEERDDLAALHTANIVLGRLALQAGDREVACAYLLAAADSGDSPAPFLGVIQMSLAKELLEVGERDVVLRFLNRCARLEQWSHSRIQEWIQAVERGEMPNFGHHART